MFKRFSKEEVSGHTQLKASVQRAIRNQLCEQYPMLEEHKIIDVLLPKKEQMLQLKCPEKVSVIVVQNTPLFFSNREGKWMPTLRVLHQYPDMMPKLRADQGAIKFVLSGANIMCPGLTSAGATIHDEVPEGTPVAIYAENKEHAMAIGITKMSTEDMRTINKGIGVELMHYLNDGLWKTTTLDG